MWQDIIMEELNKAAQALGRLGKGIPKNISQKERKRRSEWMKTLNKIRKSKKTV